MQWDRNKERKASRVLGIGGSIYAIVFMIIWCAIAASRGAWFMLLFGIPMLGFVIFRLIIMLRKRRETPRDPWEQPPASAKPAGSGFCPHCGRALEEQFAFCPHCGRRK